MLEKEAVEIFKYRKNNNDYCDKAKLYEQVVNKTLPIIEALDPGYSLLFLFNNATNYSLYVKNVLQIKDINKRCEGK